MEEKHPVLDGAEPFYFEGGDTGVLVLHGFTGTTQSMRYLGEQLRDAGFTVCGPRLKGHGTHYEDMEETTYQDWLASAEEGYQWLKQRCSQIFITGLSMGGTLTLHLAADHPEVKGIIPINAAVDIPELEQLKGASEPRFLDAIGSDIKQEGANELAYDKTPLQAVQQLLTFMEKTRDRLEDIKCPALIYRSVEDHVVPPLNSSMIYNEIESEEKEIIDLPESYHVATLDNDKETIADGCISFIKKHS